LLTHQAAFDAPIEALSTSLFWLFAVAVLLVLLALTGVATRLLSPIRRLTEAVGGTTRAAEFKSLPVETTDEVGALTRTFNAIFGRLKDYEESLEQKVDERTEQLREAKQEVSDILDNMAQAIFTVSAGRLVNQEYSKYCKELLGDVEIAGVDALDLLRLTDGDPKRKSLRFWLDTVLGAAELQWALAGGTGPVKELSYVRPGSGETLVLQLEYAPIYADGLLDKVMIIARDMTVVVRLQDEVIKKDDQNRENLATTARLATSTRMRMRRTVTAGTSRRSSRRASRRVTCAGPSPWTRTSRTGPDSRARSRCRGRRPPPHLPRSASAG
jgi:nitrogen fixation/metabolism regulation signal transduction histidine kinase